jgi:hypothetical protein
VDIFASAAEQIAGYELACKQQSARRICVEHAVS